MSFSGNAGGDPSIYWQVSPTGGVVVLNLHSIADPATWSLSRSGVSYLPTGVSGAIVSGSVGPVLLVSGAAQTIPFFVDIGDGTNTPLNPQTLYSYRFATAQGIAITDPISVSGAIVLEPDHLTRVLGRSLQAGLVSLVLPTNFTQRPTFSYSMPVTTQMRFPMVLLNLDLLQQESIPIGQGQPSQIVDNSYSVPAMAMRRYVVRVFATNVDERDFYRDAVIAIFNTILTPLLAKIGVNTSHRFQASNGQIVTDQMQPGAFYAEISLQFSGLYNVTVSTNFPIIGSVIGQATGAIGSIIADPYGSQQNF